MSNLAAAMSDLTAAIGGGKGFFAGIKGIFGGGKAEGGPTNQSVPYIVGEKGPELFVPKTDGTIIPNHVIGRQNGGNMTAGGFATQLLKGLGANATPQAIADLVYWEGKEGGNWHNTASFNPLNTSYQMNGSTNYNSHKAGGGVQAYNSWNQGLQATIGTLTGQGADARGYTNIVNILKNGGTSTANFLKAMQASSWDGGHYGSTTLTPSTASGSSGSSAYQVAPDPTAATRLAEAQARAFGTQASVGGSSTNYNYGGISIVINGATDPKKTADAINQHLKNNQLLTQAGKK